MFCYPDGLHVVAGMIRYPVELFEPTELVKSEGHTCAELTIFHREERNISKGIRGAHNKRPRIALCQPALHLVCKRNAAKQRCQARKEMCSFYFAAAANSIQLLTKIPQNCRGALIFFKCGKQQTAQVKVPARTPVWPSSRCVTRILHQARQVHCASRPAYTNFCTEHDCLAPACSFQSHQEK